MLIKPKEKGEINHNTYCSTIAASGNGPSAAPHWMVQLQALPLELSAASEVSLSAKQESV